MTASEPGRPGAGGAPVVGRTTPGSEPAPAVPVPATTREEPPRRPRTRLRPAAWAALLSGVTVGILVALFAAQNSQGVEVHFLGYSSRTAPQFLIILLSVLLGLVIGLLFGLGRGRRRA